MAIIKKKDISKMSKDERDTKIKELKLELVKGSVAANKTNAKTKEIKRTIARLMTFNNSNKEALKK